MHPTIRRTLVSLSAAFALQWSAASMVAGPGSAALVALTGKQTFAGLFIALINVGAATGAFLGGRAMDRFGRRPLLVGAYLFAAIGFATAGMGVASGAIAPFVVGALVFSTGFGVIGLTRLAVGEIFPASERGRAVAWVQTSAIGGAILGPLLLVLSEPLGRTIGRPPLTLVWFLAPPLLIVASLIASRAHEPTQIARDLERYHPVARDAARPPTIETGARPVFAATVALAASQGAMASVMGVAGAAVVHAGHGMNVLGGMMLLHFMGMFGLSRFVGNIADRFGRRATILTGLAVLAIGGTVVATIEGTTGFGIGLFLAGLGWSFAYLGATVLLTDITPPAHRARTLGRADLGSQLTGAVVALAGGYWFAANGLPGLGLVAIAVVILPAIAFLFVAEPRPGHYGASSPLTRTS